jgi:hypothetical protein
LATALFQLSDLKREIEERAFPETAEKEIIEKIGKGKRKKSRKEVFKQSRERVVVHPIIRKIGQIFLIWGKRGEKMPTCKLVSSGLLLVNLGENFSPRGVWSGSLWVGRALSFYMEFFI